VSRKPAGRKAVKRPAGGRPKAAKKSVAGKKSGAGKKSTKGTKGTTSPSPAQPAEPAVPGRQRSGPAKKSGKSGKGQKSSDGHGLKVQVRTARKRTHSSTLWLARQLNDPYVARAKREGYRSRAAYKLIEIDERFKLLKPGMIVVDLGAAPGGWAQHAAAQVRSIDQNARGAGRVIGIDLLEIENIPGVEFTVMDFTAEDAPAQLRAMMAQNNETALADAVLSDMAANTTGHRKTDHLRIMYLAELAVEFAREVLAPGGIFLSKVFQGGTEGELLTMLKRDFQTVRHIKPKASRSDSAELYVLATGFRGHTDDGESAGSAE
jgi:23S rRNA (uridine2552-2'-O)-methyltransferase